MYAAHYTRYFVLKLAWVVSRTIYWVRGGIKQYKFVSTIFIPYTSESKSNITFSLYFVVSVNIFCPQKSFDYLKFLKIIFKKGEYQADMLSRNKQDNLSNNIANKFLLCVTYCMVWCLCVCTERNPGRTDERTKQ